MTAVEEGKGIARYRSFLAVPHTRALFGWALLARLPLGMAPLALLLLVRAEGASYAAAGAVVAAYGLALAGRCAGLGPARRPARPVRRPHCGGRSRTRPASRSSSGWRSPMRRSSAWGSLPQLAGAVIPPVSSSVRSIWPQVLPDELRSTAYSLEAAFQEIIFVVGPILAAALAALEPSLAVGFTGARDAGRDARVSYGSSRSGEPARAPLRGGVAGRARARRRSARSWSMRSRSGSASVRSR